MSAQITPQILQDALLRADHPEVKIIVGRVCESRVTAAVALAMLLSGGYVASGSRHRVRQLRRRDGWKEPRVLTWSACYRTTEAPALQPSIEWLHSRLGA